MRISLTQPPGAGLLPRITLPAPELNVRSSIIQLPSATAPNVSPKKRARHVSGHYRRKKRAHVTNPPLELAEGSDHIPLAEADTLLLTDSAHLDLISSGSLNHDEGLEPGGEEFDLAFAVYVDTVAAHAVSIIQICNNLFVVQGWNARFNWGTDIWYHLYKKHIGDNVVMSCSCPHHSVYTQCFHVLYMTLYGREKFPDGCVGLGEEDDDAILFLCEEVGDDRVMSHFSVPSPGGRRSKSLVTSTRAFVVHEGGGSGNGSWTCSRDKSLAFECIHIGRARAHARGTENESSPAIGLADLEEPEVPVRTQMGTSVVRNAVREETSPISYLPILPPSWCWIPGDVLLYARPRPLRDAPALLILDDTSQCQCGRFYDPSNPIVEKDCTVYSLVEAFPCRIQTQNCTSCPGRKKIGPETRNLGIFNLNNTTLLTHDLLDDYTSAFTTSETPFVAWVNVISRRYADYHSPFKFMDHKLFRSAWYAYAKLQAFEADMHCPDCGPYPDQVICDGTALSLDGKYVLPTLKPPTVSGDGSSIRSSRYLGRQQYIPDSKLRKQIKTIIDGPRLLSSGELKDLSTGAKGDAAAAQRLKSCLQLSIHVDTVCMELASICSGLGTLFRKSYSIQAAAVGYVPPKTYVSFFKQLAAEESAVQMANRPALERLDEFNKAPSAFSASNLVGIPALLAVLSGHKEGYPEELLDVCRWMHQRGQAILLELIKHHPDEVSEMAEEDWCKTGCYYSMPQIRARPKYPSLVHDIRAEPAASRGAKCSKFFTEYRKKKLTGGLMAIWCPHIICYGFHCIPLGEGRNDVFSALYTRWPHAPKYIVYDFACALGPYCMTREPDFFADSTFVIDQFHASDHTKCEEACFLSTYVGADPRLGDLNCSAAECGNSGLKRIRKVVRFSGQERSMIYTKVFLAVWNRARIRKILKVVGTARDGV